MLRVAWWSLINWTDCLHELKRSQKEKIPVVGCFPYRTTNHSTAWSAPCYYFMYLGLRFLHVTLIPHLRGAFNANRLRFPRRILQLRSELLSLIRIPLDGTDSAATRSLDIERRCGFVVVFSQCQYYCWFCLKQKGEFNSKLEKGWISQRVTEYSQSVKVEIQTTHVLLGAIGWSENISEVAMIMAAAKYCLGHDLWVPLCSAPW